MFDGVKRLTLPDQAMSLAEMFRRFVRREPLPVEKAATYIETNYDLEKIAKLDRVEKDEILAVMREETKLAEHKVAQAKKKKQEEEDASKVPPISVEQKDPKGDDPVKNPPPKGA